MLFRVVTWRTWAEVGAWRENRCSKGIILQRGRARQPLHGDVRWSSGQLSGGTRKNRLWWSTICSCRQRGGQAQGLYKRRIRDREKVKKVYRENRWGRTTEERRSRAKDVWMDGQTRGCASFIFKIREDNSSVCLIRCGFDRISIKMET
jgi:hypothetical protein